MIGPRSSHLTRTNMNSSFLWLSNISLCVWSGLPFPSPGDLSDLGIEPRSPALQADALPSEPPRKSLYICIYISVQVSSVAELNLNFEF